MPTAVKSVLYVSVGGLLVASPLLVACVGPTSNEPSGYRNWAATDGAAGRINMDDVQLAFQTSSSATDFENRVNEIYEGDGLVLVRVSQEESVFILEGWEDLDKNDEIEDDVDDHLFSIVRHEDEQHEIVGHHANSYYHSGFGGGDFLFGYIIGSSLGGSRYYYQTPPTRAVSMRYERGLYRGTNLHSTQLDSNRQYTHRQQTFSGSKYQQASRSLGMNRGTYQSIQKTTGSFRSSGAVTGGRSTSITRGGSVGSSGGRGGGFSGAGGRVLIRTRCVVGSSGLAGLCGPSRLVSGAEEYNHDGHEAT